MSKIENLLEEINKSQKHMLLHDVNMVITDTGKALLATNSGYLYNQDELVQMEKEIELLQALIINYRTFIAANGNEFIEAANERRLELVNTFYSSSPKAPKSKKKTFVYLMHNKQNGFYKIGRSLNPVLRENTLQAQEPDVHLVFQVEATAAYEAELHQKYAEKRIRGEWFRLEEKDVQEIMINKPL